MTAMDAEAGTCVICGAVGLSEIGAFPAFLRVTSDCRPYQAGGRLAVCRRCGGVQKPNDASWRADCDRIYADYALYAQSGGVEQQAFGHDTGQMTNRSAAILRHVAASLPTGPDLRILDYGCGLGAMIRALGDAFPDQRICGLDTSRRFEATLTDLPGFAALFLPESLPAARHWDLITMIHCLEHIPEPVAVLRRLRDALAPGGRLLIQVPDTEINPFDLVVADHRTHFSKATLKHLLERAGFQVIILDSGAVPTELTAVVEPSTDAARVMPAEPAAAFAAGHLRRLASFRDLLNHGSDGGTLGVFGSSIAANWLIPHAPERVSHVLDEDPHRHGVELFGCPIIAPDRAPAGLTVVLPFVRPVAERIATRLAALPLRFLYPAEDGP